MIPSRHNSAITKWLDKILQSHVEPSKEVAEAHDAKIKKLIHDIEEELPKNLNCLKVALLSWLDLLEVVAQKWERQTNMI